MIKIDYEQTDKKIKIDIYGLIFEISKEIENINSDYEKIEDYKDVIDKVLGDGATDKINEKRKSDGYGEIDTQVFLAIISTAMNAYVNASTQPINNMINNYEDKTNRFNKYGNRKNRRDYRYRRY